MSVLARRAFAVAFLVLALCWSTLGVSTLTVIFAGVSLAFLFGDADTRDRARRGWRELCTDVHYWTRRARRTVRRLSS